MPKVPNRSKSDIKQIVSPISKDPKTKINFFTYFDDNGKLQRVEEKQYKQIEIRRKEIIKKVSLRSEGDKKAVQSAKKRYKKGTKITKRGSFSLDNHFTEISELYLQGKNERFIMLYLNDNYGVSLGAANDYLAKFKKKFIDYVDKDSEDIILTHIKRYDLLYSFFQRNGYNKLAARMLGYKEQLMGAQEKIAEIRADLDDRMLVGLNIEKIVHMSDYEEFKELLSKVSKLRRM